MYNFPKSEILYKINIGEIVFSQLLILLTDIIYSKLSQFIKNIDFLRLKVITK